VREIFSLLYPSRPTQTTVQWIPGFLNGVKRCAGRWRRDDHLPCVAPRIRPGRSIYRVIKKSLCTWWLYC